MPNNDALHIAECKEIRDRHNAQCVVMLTVDPDGSIHLYQHSQTEAKSQALQPWLKSVWDGLPANPFVTVFGRGHGGVGTG